MNFIDVHDRHCCKKHGCKYGDINCTVVNGVCEGVECEDCEFDRVVYLNYYVDDSSIKYQLSYNERYALDHLSEDIDFNSHTFDTLDEAWAKYESLKNKNTTKNYPYCDFTIIEYKEILND